MQFIDVNQEQLVFAETHSPIPKPNQCLIKVKAIGVNRADILQRQGKYPPPPGESDILGLEVAGEIVQLPNENSDFKLGDKVCGLVAGGGYAEYAVINQAHLIKLPTHFTFEQGAATAEVFLTAYQSLFTIANLQPNTKVLIHAGASGVGGAAIQLAKARGCYVVTTVGSNAKAEACLALGADVAINYREANFVYWSKEHNCQFNTILDVVAGDYLAGNIKVAALDAHIVILAILGGRFAEQVDVARLLQKRIQITASTLRNRTDSYKADLVTGFNSEFLPLLNNKSLKPVIHQCYPWQEVEEAHQCMMSNENIGKLILSI